MKYRQYNSRFLRCATFNQHMDTIFLPAVESLSLYSTSLWNTAVDNRGLPMMPTVYLLFPLLYYWHLFISRIQLMFAECLFRPAHIQKLHCIKPCYTSYSKCCTQCDIITGTQDRHVHGISSPSNISLHLMKFPIERPKFNEARLKYLA